MKEEKDCVTGWVCVGLMIVALGRFTFLSKSVEAINRLVIAGN